MGSISPDHDPCCDGSVEADRLGTDGEVADPVPDQSSTGVQCPADEAVVEDRARHDPGGPAYGAGDFDVPIFQPQLAHRDPVVEQTCDTHVAQKVKDVRRDAVTARLVTREVSLVDEHNGQFRLRPECT
jgi:hypothetical protein